MQPPQPPSRADTFGSKLPDIGPTIFAAASALARDNNALDLAQGFPNFEPPKALLDRVGHYLHAGRNQYPPPIGVPELRQALAAKVQVLYGRNLDAETEITIVSGATEALFCAIAASVYPGDEAIVLEPAYDSYAPVIRLQGGTVVPVPLTPPDFRIDWQRVEDAVTRRTRLIITNSPHNPTGTVFDTVDLAALRGLCERHGIWVIADEVYEHILFDGRHHQSVLRDDALFARSFAIFSFGKTYHATGWKIGYCLAPAGLSREFRRVHQYVTYSTIPPVQLALADYLAATPEHHEGLADFYQKKRDLFVAQLTGSRFRLTPAAGTYFQVLDYGTISTEPDCELARRWTETVGIASIPISVFYGTPPRQTLLRFCFAKSDETLARAGEILRAL